MPNFLWNFERVTTESAIVSYYAEKESTCLLIALSLIEKNEIDEKVETTMICDDEKICNNYTKIINDILQNILIGPSEKTKLKVTVNIVSFDDFLFKTLFDCLCVCLIESGLEMNDTFCAFSNSRISLVYSVNINAVLYCFWLAEGNYSQDLGEAISACIISLEYIRKYIEAKYA